MSWQGALEGERGFTLVELMLVIVLMGVLAAVASSMWFGAIERGQQGGLVVWCGSLQTTSKFQGIILNLKGDGTSFGATNCATNPNTGIFRNDSAFLQAWLYANGGTSSRAGIELGPGSTIKSVPSGE